MSERTGRAPLPMNELAQDIYQRHTHIEPNSEHGVLWFDSGVQHFRIGAEFESAEHADWFRRQLANALARMVESLP